jgi:site-specific DNA-methyltransferase (cytosine-N4-specific)
VTHTLSPPTDTPQAPAPYFTDSQVTLYLGDSLEVLRGLPDQSVDCCVTSPPYFGLRDYGEDGQYGLEASPAEYVETMRAVFAEVRRVLADDGTLWLNIGDSYSGSWGNQGRKAERGTQRAVNGPMLTPVHDGRYPSSESNTGAIKPGAPPAKNLMGMPWRIAFALQDDGWILRNDVIWAKPNGMPESVTDRLSTKHEHVFMMSKSPRYWFDLDPIRENSVTPERHASSALSWNRDSKEAEVPGQSTRQHRTDRAAYQAPGRWADGSGGRHRDPGDNGLGLASGGKNPGDVWTLATQPFSEAHFAVMPKALAERAILAGCKPGGVVLDPFSGSGTTGLAANKHGRKYVGIDLSKDYLDLSLRTRFAQPGLNFGGASA